MSSTVRNADAETCPNVHLDGLAQLLARARFRTKREVEHLVAEIAPRADAPARIEPLGPRTVGARNSWQAFVAALAGPVRELAHGVNAGDAPPVPENEPHAHSYAHEPEPERREEPVVGTAPERLISQRYRVEFTASQRYVELLEEARNLLQRRVPNRDVARVHELAMEAFVEQLRKRRQAATRRARRERSSEAAPARVDDATERSAPARVSNGTKERPAPARMTDPETRRPAPERVNRPHVPADVRRTVWARDEARCTFEDANGRRCAERAGLEIHHVHAFALGGSATVENLRLVCRAHNALFAERAFGKERMQRVVERGG